jgi:hypothetical protein
MLGDHVASLRRSVVALSCLVAILLAGSTLPVTAETPVPVDDPPVGRHVLIDNGEFPGANCRSQSFTDLVSIRVRRPVMYARNRTSGTDHQTVGWRWQLRDESFSAVAQGPIAKASATDKRPAAFSNQTVGMSGRPEGVYFISIRMYWFKPGSSTQVQGTARHFVRNYARNGDTVFPFDTGCNDGVSISVPLSGHAGDRGVHVLLDDVHTAPVRCIYGPGALGGLVEVKVRQPIVLAHDTGSGTQTQDVRWRFIVEGTEDGVPDKESVWTQLTPSVPFAVAGASDRRPAGFGVRGRTIDVAERGFANYRVRILVNWLRPDGSVDGSAVHTVGRYQIVNDAGSTVGVDDLCGPSPAIARGWWTW